MAKTNGMISGLFSGMLGKEVVFRNLGDRTIACAAPGPRTKKASKAQLKNENMFRMGNRFATAVLQDPDLKAAYARAVKTRQTPHSRAVQDYCNPPVVTDVAGHHYKGKPGDIIEIRATDDFHVAKVFVEIRDAEGNKLESGYAVVQPFGTVWHYTVTAPNELFAGSRITAWAVDIPGNEGSLEVLL
ncbi:hypothetical protein [Flavihumibacter petaseus]|uniref:Uncharacterized protein n=1 Tax=Flavihumibacter petaseus NBRC 106054 TaxID=1220578 RepID=A0A0E9MWA2_9BACT|nr:hypothetical protein [Flavihumibacter petaseus]GAO41380.1 hypothetical protein FPE01S_01_03920 [Flavihumibacter petaseus NBRC 106054]